MKEIYYIKIVKHLKYSFYLLFNSFSIESYKSGLFTKLLIAIQLCQNWRNFFCHVCHIFFHLINFQGQSILRKLSDKSYFQMMKHITYKIWNLPKLDEFFWKTYSSNIPWSNVFNLGISSSSNWTSSSFLKLQKPTINTFSRYFITKKNLIQMINANEKKLTGFLLPI